MRKRRMTVSFNTPLRVRMKGINNIIALLQRYNSSLKIKYCNGMMRSLTTGDYRETFIWSNLNFIYKLCKRLSKEITRLQCYQTKCFIIDKIKIEAENKLGQVNFQSLKDKRVKSFLLAHVLL